MAKRQFQLSEQEIRQLRQAEQQTQNVLDLRRLQAVRLYGSGAAMQEITNITNCTGRSVRRWSQRYKEKGLEGLRSQWTGENALKLSREQRADLKRRMYAYRPDQVLEPDIRISQGQFWTISDLQLAVQKWYRVTYGCRESYRLLMAECGFSYQKVEAIYRSRAKEQAIADFEAELEKK